MARPKNHRIERSSSAPANMSATWDLAHQGDTQSWRNFHVFGRNLDTGEVRRFYTVPANDANWIDGNLSDDNKEVVFPSQFYPATRWLLSEVDHHSLGMHVGGSTASYLDNVDVASFSFAEPLPPKVTLTRSDLKLTFKVDANESEMPNTSKHYRTDTQLWVQRITYGQSWPSYSKYRMPSPAKTFAGSSAEHVHSAERTYTPDRPVKVRVLAMNRGPSGASDFASEEHVFAQVNTPTVSVKSVRASGANSITAFSVNPNADSWHPVDHIVLQRQKGPSMNPSGSWEDMVDIADVAQNVNLVADDTASQVPGEDEATFWRVMTWHDDKAANCAYGYPASQPVRAGKPKAPSGVTASINNDPSDAEYGFVTATWTINSACSPNHVAELWGKRGPSSPMERIESKTLAAGVSTVKFESDYRSLSSFSVRVQAYKPWSASQKTSSDWAGSVSMATVSIDSLTLLDDGSSLYVSETHDDDDSDYTEYSWSTRGDGWACTEEPQTYNRLSTGSASHVSIANLEEGREYYVQARRYNSSTSTFGPYSAQVSTRTGSTPGRPTLTATGRVSAGSPVEFEWDFPGGNQAAAMLFIEHDVAREESFLGDGATKDFPLALVPDALPEVTVDGEPAECAVSGTTLTLFSAPAEGSVVSASYTAPSGITTVGVDGDDMALPYDTDESWEGELTAYVKVTTGGNWSEASLPVAVEVVQPPTCEASPAGTLEPDPSCYGGYKLTALPLTLGLGGTAGLFDVTVTCVNGSSLPSPGGVARVAAGSNVAWAPSCAPGESAIVSERGALVGGGQYDVTVIGRDPSTGAKSEPQAISFTVEWANPAKFPTVEAYVSDGEGKITVTADPDAPTTDRLDIWRKTADGAVVCASDAAFGKEYTDPVPPYGWDGNAYIAQVTTVDGDTCWAEAAYEMASGGVTVNWDDKSVVLPWNIDVSDKYSTQFEVRAHMDGSRVGYWQRGSDRTATISGELVRGKDAETVNDFRALGRYAGIAFVRANRGVAFACNADVDMEEGYMSGSVPVTLTLTEVDDDGTWRATTEAGE